MLEPAFAMDLPQQHGEYELAYPCPSDAKQQREYEELVMTARTCVQSVIKNTTATRDAANEASKQQREETAKKSATRRGPMRV